VLWAAIFSILMAIWIIPTSPLARTWYITPVGTGDAPTIQAGIDSAAPGDTVLVACGIYYEREIQLTQGVFVRSETGLSDCVTIDAQRLARVAFCSDVDSCTVLEGFTLTGRFILKRQTGKKQSIIFPRLALRINADTNLTNFQPT